jgi:hypothetical protein
VKFCNASVLGRRDEGVAPISEGEGATQSGSWFQRGGATGGCSSVETCNRQPESSGVWIDLRWKTISRARKSVWVGYCCGDQTCCRNGLGWERDIFGSKENCEEEFELVQFK